MRPGDSMRPARVLLATTPTPVQRLERLSEALGTEVLVKRDDLTGAALSGNKVRKLELLLGEALAMGADTVLTTGGLQSNHCRATAVAARRVGIEPRLLLRGALPSVPEGNLLLDRLLGAQLRTCTAEAYRSRRNDILEEMAEAARQDGRRPYVVPEGGSNAVGSRAFTIAAHELLTQIEPPDRVVCAVGSGGTLAGLAMAGCLPLVSGVAVCDDRATFAAKVRAIDAESVERFGGSGLGVEGESWEVVEGYQGPAYAVAEPEVWETIAWVARLEGLILDPVYTGKAMHALVSEVRAGRWGGRIVFWHTGGMFGLFGRGAELPA